MSRQDAPKLPPTLPFHLALAWLEWLSSNAALHAVNAASASWKQAPNPFGPLADPRLGQAVVREASRRAEGFLKGISLYAASPRARTAQAGAPAVWRHGAARLLDYGRLASLPEHAPALLVIPSLINRHYILDLAPERSLMRFLLMRGFRPLVLDWGSPGGMEEDFDCADYVTAHMLPALAETVKLTGRRPFLLGYCMGGVLAMALAQLRKKDVRGLALLATPWDFHAADFVRVPLDPPALEQVERLLGTRKTLPPEAVQMLFYLSNPWVLHRKYRRYAELEPHSQAAVEFLQLEQWVNDGVPMTSGVARDCLIEWVQKNTLARRQWRVNGTTIQPHLVTTPCFVAVPEHDHIVPPGCAFPLAYALPNAEVIRPGAGHVGMIVGSRSKPELWEPLARWLECAAA